MKVEIVTYRDGKETVVDYQYEKRDENDRPMALDVLLQAHRTTIPDLSYRYGCRNRVCGLCTIDINGRPRVGCRARVRDGDRLSAPNTLPTLRDFIVQRDGIARQLRGHLPNGVRSNDLNVEAPDDYHDLSACIECYACLEGCPMHARNLNGGTDQRDENGAYRWGNPFSLLKLQRVRLDPLTTEPERQDALQTARDLGLQDCIGCPGCKCGVGVDLKGQVIKPLVEAAETSNNLQ